MHLGNPTEWRSLMILTAHLGPANVWANVKQSRSFRIALSVRRELKIRTKSKKEQEQEKNRKKTGKEQEKNKKGTERNRKEQERNKKGTGMFHENGSKGK